MREKIHTIRRLMQISHTTCRRHMAVVMADSLFASLLAILWTMMPAQIVSEYQAGNLLGVYIDAAILLAGSLCLRCLGIWCKNMIKIDNRKIKDEIDARLDEKIMDIDYQDTETPRIIDLKEKAIWTFENYGGITYFIQHIAGCVASAITVIWCVAILASNLSAGMLLLLCGYILLMIGMGKHRRRCEGEYWNHVTPLNRKFLYLTWNVAYNYECGKDIRIYDAAPMVKGQLQILREQWRNVESVYHKEVWENASIAAVARIALLIAISLLILQQNLGMTASVLCVSTMVQFLPELAKLLDDISNVLQMATYGEYTVSLLEMPGAKQTTGNVPIGNRQEYTVEFQNVSFCYPGEQKQVLNNVSFVWKSGEKTAIVGRNGAGKTTIVKLLCRLYEPTSGKILLNGRKIQEYSGSEYRKLLGIVFQDFKLFPFSIQENIVMHQEKDLERLQKLYKAYGVEAITEGLPGGDQTNLDRRFDPKGVELSGGQKQEVAITRVFYRLPHLVMLDEPSSALDVKTEESLYHRIMNEEQQAGLFFISHRLSSCKYCDAILVMKEGELIERGNHDELMKRQGEYYTLFSTQAKLYTD